MRVILPIGTRPGIIKAAILQQESRKRDVDFTVVDTGQHYDYNLDGIFREELDLEVEHCLDVKSDGPWQVAETVRRLDAIYGDEHFDLVLTSGDTNSTLGSAVWAQTTGRKLAHLEAGMRCGDRKLPEERIRMMVDAGSDLLLCSTRRCYNLISDIKHLDQEVYLTGDVTLDLFEKVYPEVEPFFHPDWDYFLVTVHRQENMNREFFDNLFIKMDLENDYYFIFPTHPRTREFIETNFKREELPTNLLLWEPVSHTTMMSLLKGAERVWTDSGGVERECIFAEKQHTVLRRSSEWTGECRENFGRGHAAARVFDAIAFWEELN